MPIYVYRCTGCDNLIDRLCAESQRETPVTCPACGERAAHSLALSISGFDWRRGLRWTMEGYASQTLERHRPGTTDGTGIMT